MWHIPNKVGGVHPELLESVPGQSPNGSTMAHWQAVQGAHAATQHRCCQEVRVALSLEAVVVLTMCNGTGIMHPVNVDLWLFTTLSGGQQEGPPRHGMFNYQQSVSSH
jgi:hypothetical protein